MSVWGAVLGVLAWCAGAGALIARKLNALSPPATSPARRLRTACSSPTRDSSRRSQDSCLCRQFPDRRPWLSSRRRLWGRFRWRRTRTTFALITGPTATGNSVSPTSPDSGPTARAVDPVVPDESSLSRRQHIETCVDITGAPSRSTRVFGSSSHLTLFASSEPEHEESHDSQGFLACGAARVALTTWLMGRPTTPSPLDRSPSSDLFLIAALVMAPG